jgi:hypothetical protein
MKLSIKDNKAQQYWEDHELYHFIKFSQLPLLDISLIYYKNKIITIGTVEHNGWKFSVMNDGTIKYITPTGEKGFFNDVEI